MTSTAGKRAMDVVVGLVLSLLAVPLVLLLAAAMLVELRAWPFFSQERIGKDGRSFRIVKIRTLPPGTPAYASKAQLVAVSRLAQLVRRLHLDELPQLVLVVTGRLSLVGPRPEMPFLDDAMDSTFSAVRTSVRPGCTGLWQLSEVVNEPIAAFPAYDCWYVDHATLRLDAWVLWRTLLLMTGIGRPVAIEDIPRWTTWRAGDDVQALAPAEAAADVVS